MHPWWRTQGKTKPKKEGDKFRLPAVIQRLKYLKRGNPKPNITVEMMCKGKELGDRVVITPVADRDTELAEEGGGEKREMGGGRGSSAMEDKLCCRCRERNRCHLMRFSGLKH